MALSVCLLAAGQFAGHTAPARAAEGSGGFFTPVTPYRVTGTQPPTTLAGGQTAAIKVAGTGPVPTTAMAVVINATVASASATTFLTAYPSGSQRPTASNLNAVRGQVVANLVQVPIGSDGVVDVYNNAGQTSFYLDVVGYFDGSGSSSYVPVSPSRILDTRQGGNAPIGPSGTLRLTVAGDGVVPAGATAVVLNLTGTDPTADTFLTAYPDGVDRPITSNLNLLPRATVPNLVTVGLGSGGAIDLYNNRGSTQVIADVVGYYATSSSSGLQFTGITPGRLVDTRNGLGRPAGAVGPGQSIDVPVDYYGVPADAQAVVLNVTGTGGTAGSDFVTAYPTGQSRPTASTLNLGRGQTAANLDIVKVGSNGQVSLYNNAGSVSLIADVVGYLSSTYGQTTTPVAPPTYRPLSCSAQMSNPHPPRKTTDTVEVSTGVGGATVTATAHYKTTATTETGTSDADGSSRVPFQIGNATVGYTVVVNVTVSLNGQNASCSTQFTPAQ